MTGRDLIWLVCGAVLFFGLAHNPEEPDELTKAENTYCEMVTTFKETNGQFGWPDYHENFSEVCK